jgi:hypothetical protein
MSDALSRSRLPLLLVSLLLLIGGSKLDAVRPLEGQIIAFVIPLVALASGAEPFLDAHVALRNQLLALGALLLVVAEMSAYRVVFEDNLEAPSFAVKALLALAMAGAVWFEVAGAKRGLRSRVSAWFGLAIVFTLYFPGHAVQKNLFGSAFAAFMVALAVGGAGGLFVGEFAVRRARR